MSSTRAACRTRRTVVAASALLALTSGVASCSDDAAEPSTATNTVTIADCGALRSLLRSYRSEMEQAVFGGGGQFIGPLGPGGIPLDSTFSPSEPLSGDPGVVEAGPLAANDDWVVYVNESGAVTIIDRASRIERDTVRVPGQGFVRRVLLAGDRAVVVSNVPVEGSGGLTYEPVEVVEIDLTTGDVVDSARIDGGYRAAAVIDGTPVVLTSSQPYLSALGGGFPGGFEGEFTDATNSGVADAGEIELEVDDSGDDGEVIDGSGDDNPIPNDEVLANERLAEWISAVERSDGTETRPACERVLLPLGGGQARQTGLLSRIGPGLDIDSVGLVGSPGGFGLAGGRIVVAVNVVADPDTGAPGHSTLYALDLAGDLDVVGQAVLPGTVVGRRWISIADDVVRVASIDDQQRGRIDTFRLTAAGLEALGSILDVGAGLAPSDVRFVGDLAFVSSYTDPVVVVSLADPAAPDNLGQLGVAGLAAVVSPEPGVILAAGADSRLRGGERGTVVVGYDITGGDLSELGRRVIESMDPAVTDVRSLTVAGDRVVVVPSFSSVGSPSVQVLELSGSLRSLATVRHADPEGTEDVGTDCELLDDEDVAANLPPGIAFPGMKVLICEEDDNGGLEGYFCNIVTPEQIEQFGNPDDASEIPEGSRLESCFPDGPVSLFARPVVIDGEVWLADASGILTFPLDDPGSTTWIS